MILSSLKISNPTCIFWITEDKEAWSAAVHGIVNNQTTEWLNNSLYLDSSQTKFLRRMLLFTLQLNTQLLPTQVKLATIFKMNYHSLIHSFI